MHPSRLAIERDGLNFASFAAADPDVDLVAVVAVCFRLIEKVDQWGRGVVEIVGVDDASPAGALLAMATAMQGPTPSVSTPASSTPSTKL
ncbi:hypothetical protein DMC25_00170 [Caulobacter sp. D4A]|nr:hypothetical protein DMC25_00170 [Caulobacter sp. D4A]